MAAPRVIAIIFLQKNHLFLWLLRAFEAASRGFSLHCGGCAVVLWVGFLPVVACELLAAAFMGSSSCAVVLCLWALTFCNPRNGSLPGSSVHGILPGVGCHFLLQGIFTTQGSNPHFFHLLHWQVDSLPLHRLGGPSSSLTRNQTWAPALGA